MSSTITDTSITLPSSVMRVTKKSSFRPEQNEMLRQALRDWISAERKRRGKDPSQIEIARLLEIRQQTVNSFLRASAPTGTSYETATRIAKLVGHRNLEAFWEAHRPPRAPLPSTSANDDASSGLERLLAHHLLRWNSATIAAARSLADSGARFSDQQWAQVLDDIQAAIERSVAHARG